MKLALLGAVLEPVVAHINRFRTALLEGAIENAEGCGNVQWHTHVMPMVWIA